MSGNSCYEQFKAEADTFETIVYTSLALTLVNFVVARILIARELPTWKLAYYHGVTGTLKLFLALLIYLRIPTCPSGCTCVGGHVNPMIAVLPLAVGCLWIFRGYTYYKLSSSGQEPNSIQFTDSSGRGTKGDYEMGSVDEVAELT